MIDWGKLRADLAAEPLVTLDDAAALVAIKAMAPVVSLGAARLDAMPDQIIGAFTPLEWAAAKALAPTEPVIAWWFDRLLARVEPIDLGPGSTFRGGVDFLTAKGVLTEDRGTALVVALTAGARTETPFDVATYGEPIELYHVQVARKG